MVQTTHIDADEAGRVIRAAIAKARELGVPQNVAVADAAGHLVAFHRMDDAKFLSIEIALAKAFTAAGLRAETAGLAPRTVPGGPGVGIQHLHAGRLTTLAGGVPIERDGQVIGGIGVSSGTTEQDEIVARTGAGALSSP
jgi:uncharacterized protein GlcG (DUF336 family)